MGQLIPAVVPLKNKMDDKLTLKEIVLKKLDRTLNPNFPKKFIWALFLLGSSLVAIPSIGFIAELVIKWKAFEVSLSVIDQPVAYISIASGILIIIISAILFSKHTDTNQDKAYGELENKKKSGYFSYYNKQLKDDKYSAGFKEVTRSHNVKNIDEKEPKYLSDSFFGIKWEWNLDSNNKPINIKGFCPQCSSNITPSTKGYGSLTTLDCLKCRYMPEPANFAPDQIIDQITNLVMVKLKNTTETLE